MATRFLSSLLLRATPTIPTLRLTPSATRRHFQSINNLPRNAALATLFATTITVPALADSNQPFTYPFLNDDHPPILHKSEPQTGINFPLSLPSGETLQGTGVRLMAGLVQVYAVGIYVNPDQAKTALQDWSGFAKSDIIASQSLWNRICDPHTPLKRVLRMVVVREVGGEHMRDGFKRGLLPRVTALAKKGKCKPAECKQAVREFANLFVNVGKMKVGSDIRIEVEKGVVSVTVDQRLMGEIRNPQLAWALIDMFLGESAVAPSLRLSTAEGLEELLSE